ncbi:MAG: RNA polymerase factor sigma-54 [Phycisphaerales bacterium]
MRFETSQHLKMGQHMKLAPRMIQSMEILQMPLAELQERIQQELENNPTLELTEREGEAASEVAGDDVDLVASVDEDADTDESDGPVSEDERELDVGEDVDDFARLEKYEETNPEAAENEFDESPKDVGQNAPESVESAEQRTRDEDFDYSPRQRSDDDRDAKMEAMAATPARAISLGDQLLEQWGLAEVKPELKPLGELIISFLDADGYLRTGLDVVSDRAPGEPKPTVAELENALKAVQLFLEPPGVAARDARECLLLQIDALEDGEDERKIEPEVIAHARLIIENHLDDLMNNRLPRVSEKTKLSLTQIRSALELLKKLSLAPARRLVTDDVRPIVADAIVEYDAEKDRYVAYLNETRIPDLRINQQYALLGKGKEMDKRGKEFIRTNLSNASWLIDAVNQRKHTLLRVVQSVVDAQRDYFDFGPQALKPLPMTLVADQLGIHVATVSRAVSEKYIQTPRGVVPLRKFFSGGVQTEGGEDMAWDAIKVALRDIIDHEDKKKPWSDDALVDELKSRGIEIARRTVAKYRDQLNIPAARLRREF